MCCRSLLRGARCVETVQGTQGKGSPLPGRRDRHDAAAGGGDATCLVRARRRRTRATQSAVRMALLPLPFSPVMKLTPGHMSTVRLWWFKKLVTCTDSTLPAMAPAEARGSRA